MLFGKNDKIVFIGDSISDFDRKRPVGEGLNNGWGSSYVADVGALLISTYPQLNLQVVSMGIGGNQAQDLETRWQSDVMDLSPDWVSVLVGINDVWHRFNYTRIPGRQVTSEDYRACLTRLIERTLPAVKGMILMTPYFMEPNRQDPMREAMDEMGGIVRDLAAKYSLPCVDLQAAWDELFTHMHPCNIAWDRIHPNQTGHMVIARAFLKAVGYEW